MNLTIIIVNWNTKDLLKDCLYSVKQNTGSQKVNIIVVDNSSRDGSRDMVKKSFPEVQLINSGSNIGFGRANNLGIPYADTPLVLFLNPDTLVMENTIQRMIDFMKTHPSVGASSCKMKYGPGQTQTVGTDGEAHTLGLQWFPNPFTEFVSLLFLSDKTIQKFKKYLPYKDPNQSGYVSKLYGTALMVRRDVLEQIGYFDERFFMYGEDVDLSMRIIKAGWEMYYLSEVEIVHLAGAASDIAKDDFAILMTCESISKLMQKYYGKIGKYLYRLVILGGAFIRLSALLVLKTVSLLSSMKTHIPYRSSYNKYMSMIKWSLNLKVPIIKE
jgi:GT2 family glycosyltransferase